MGSRKRRMDIMRTPQNSFSFGNGKFSISVRHADIRKEEADLIANPIIELDITNDKVLLFAGEAIRVQYRNQPKAQFSVTDGGNLKARSIIHGRYSKLNGACDLQLLTERSLELAYHRKYTSVMFAIKSDFDLKDPVNVLLIRVFDEIFLYAHKTGEVPVRRVLVVFDLSCAALHQGVVDALKILRDQASAAVANCTYEKGGSCIFKQMRDLIAYRKINNKPGANSYMLTPSKMFSCMPPEWVSFDSGEPLDIIVLDPVRDSFEYQEVVRKFGIGNVLKVIRIQNKVLYEQYAFMAKQMERENPTIQNEMILYHGTDYDAVENINAFGFNRSYCGKNATAYGHGVYFTSNPRYAARDAFARVDDKGFKAIYQVRVLTGRPWVGQDETLMEPPIDPKTGTRYDSVCSLNRDIFVVFKDSRTYPEYLIVFKM